jgi:hypothetical protein
MAREGEAARDRSRSQQRSRRARSIAASLALALFAAPSAVGAATWSEIGDDAAKNGAVAFDLIVLRPLNAAALALGTVFFAVSAPFVYPFEGIDTAWDVFVYAPYEYTVVRDLGDF